MASKSQGKLLFITEAPSSEQKSFYKANTVLYRTIRAAFQSIFDRFESDETFLQFFTESGCALDYLIEKPFNRKDSDKRLALRTIGIKSLANRLKLIAPTYILVVMKDIEKYVEEAIRLSQISVEKVGIVPFPAMSEKNRRDSVVSITKELQVFLSGKND